MVIQAVTNGPQEFGFVKEIADKNKDGEQCSNQQFCMGQIGKASHMIRHGLQDNNTAGRTWEHQKQGWPVYIGGQSKNGQTEVNGK